MVSICSELQVTKDFYFLATFSAGRYLAFSNVHSEMLERVINSTAGSNVLQQYTAKRDSSIKTRNISLQGDRELIGKRKHKDRIF